MLTRIQLLIMTLIVVATMAAYIVILKLIIDNSQGIEWPFFFWIFGSFAAFAILHYGYNLVCSIGKKRHATLNKQTNEIYASLRDLFH